MSKKKQSAVSKQSLIEIKLPITQAGIDHHAKRSELVLEERTARCLAYTLFQFFLADCEVITSEVALDRGEVEVREFRAPRGKRAA